MLTHWFGPWPAHWAPARLSSLSELALGRAGFPKVCGKLCSGGPRRRAEAGGVLTSMAAYRFIVCS